MPDPHPLPEHVEILRGMSADVRQLLRVMLDTLEVFRHHSVESARRSSELEAAAAKRHEELRPVLEAYRIEIEARIKATATANAELLAERGTEEGRIKTDLDLAEKRSKVSRAKIKALALKLAELALVAALGGGAVAGYLGQDKAQAAPQEVAP